LGNLYWLLKHKGGTCLPACLPADAKLPSSCPAANSPSRTAPLWGFEVVVWHHSESLCARLLAVQRSVPRTREPHALGLAVV